MHAAVKRCDKHMSLHNKHNTEMQNNQKKKITKEKKRKEKEYDWKHEYMKLCTSEKKNSGMRLLLLPTVTK